jgi:hypothetical protein
VRVAKRVCVDGLWWLLCSAADPTATTTTKKKTKTKTKTKTKKVATKTVNSNKNNSNSIDDDDDNDVNDAGAEKENNGGDDDDEEGEKDLTVGRGGLRYWWTPQVGQDTFVFHDFRVFYMYLGVREYLQELMHTRTHRHSYMLTLNNTIH